MDNYTPTFADPIGPWHKVFAWLPTDTVDQGWKWLCFVNRRRCQMHDYLDRCSLDWFWQHITDITPRSRT